METKHTHVTLEAIREHSPCEDGWEKLLKHLGKTKADDEPLALTTILESNGLEDAVWCLSVLPESSENHVRLFNCDVAEMVLHIFEGEYPEDTGPREAIEVSRKYARGLATDEELQAACGAACGAAWLLSKRQELFIKYFG